MERFSNGSKKMTYLLQVIQDSDVKATFLGEMNKKIMTQNDKINRRLHTIDVR